MILESIFYGNFFPVEHICPNSPEYRKATQSVVTILDQLSQKLSKEDFDTVQDLLSQASTVHCLESEECFKVGFSAGLHLQRETEDALRCMTHG